MASVAPNRKSKRASWFYSFLPFNTAVGPLGTFVQLYILNLYGQTAGTVYIGLIVTLFNAVTIPSSMIWGFATDRFQRKPIIVISFFLVGINLVAFLFVSNVFGIGLLYGLFSLVSAASATPSNLLIMETESKPKWASAFARLSMISTIGTALGLVLSVFWVAYLPFESLVLPLAILSLVSALLAIALIPEPKISFERELMVMHRPSFFGRLLALPLIFLRLPKASDFKQVFKGLKYELTSYVPLLYISIFVFYLASGIFNTSLIPSMNEHGLSKSEVFAVMLTGLLVQIISLRFVGPYIEKRTLVKSAVGALALRAVCYALMGVSVYLMAGVLYIIPSLVFYPIAAGVAFAAYYTSSNTMIFNSLGERRQGSSLGVYSALVGGATMAGSFVSGYTSVYFGYYLTFIIAAFCLAISAILTSTLSKLSNDRTVLNV